MPAEWEPHAATWLAWPHYHGDWPGKFEPIPWVYCEIIRNCGEDNEVVLHTTTWYKTSQLASAAAKRWMKKNIKES